MTKKTNNKAVSNEEIIAAMMTHGTIKEAAAAVGISPKTLYNRMDNREFKIEYAEAKADLVRQAAHTLNSKLTCAIDTIAEMMTDKEVNAAVRLQAAQTIINNVAVFAERLKKDEKNAAWQRENTEFDEIFDRCFANEAHKMLIGA